MTFLPIVERELRVASRKRSTFWLRVVCALVALLIGAAFMVLSGFQGMGAAWMGDILFKVVTWLGLASVLCAGLFFTSDCLSEEKREGTLGFLFLTDLRGYDVVLGKLLATSLRSFYGLFAIFPVLAVTLVLGGVTGAQFWKTSLALLNALVCSLAAGLAVSAMSRDSQKALGATLLVLLLWVGGGPLADFIRSWTSGRNFIPVCSVSSPGYAFVSAGAWGRSLYWRGLLASQAIALLMFALASVLAPRTWREKRTRRESATGRWSYFWRYGGEQRRLRLRRKLLGRDPVLWLACRERWQSFLIWAMAILAAAGFLALLATDMPAGMWMLWTYVGVLFTFVLYLWTASQSCRFFLEARRSGMTELLLASPLDERLIVRGHWRALLRLFMVPVLMLLSVHVAGSALQQSSMRRLMSQAGTATVTGGTVTNNNGSVVYRSTGSTTNTAWQTVLTQSGTKVEQLVATIVAALAAAAATAGNLTALCWFGMWMGMTSRSANLATLKTLLFVQIIPAVAIQIGSSLLVMAVMMPYFWRMTQKTTVAPSSWLTWYPLIGAAVSASLALGKDIAFIVWSRKKLFSSFREQAAQSLGQPKAAAPPMLRTIAIPPPLPST